MNIDLSKCKLITANEYCQLSNTEFLGQTRLDENNQFYMVWSCNGIMYKTLSTL